MRRLPYIAGAAAAAITIAFALPAPASARDDHAVEALRLECAARVTDDGAAVRCEWSTPTSSEAAGLRLWRLDNAVGEHRQVVFRTDDIAVTGHTDTAVRRGHRYHYAIQAVTADGRVVAQSRPEHVGVPAGPAIEVLRLRCALAPAENTIGCEWSTPAHPDASVIELWRSVDGRARELVESFRPTGPTAYRDPVPAGASRVTYAVLAKDERGVIVARSRAQRVRIPDPTPTVATVAPAPPRVSDPPERPTSTAVTTPAAPATERATTTTTATTVTATTTTAPPARGGDTVPPTVTEPARTVPTRSEPPSRERVAP